MDTEILQVRDVPTACVAVLRQRAAARNQSLSSYLRELIRDETSQPTMDEALAMIRTRESITATADDLRQLMDEGRR